MVSSYLRRAASLVVLVGAGFGASPADVRAGQSLADVAKKEEDRRKTVRAPTKVYTNKDLTAAPAGSPPPPATSASASGDAAKDAKGAAATLAPASGPVKDEAYWSGRLKTLKDKLERNTAFADALQTKVNALTTDFVNRDDPAQRATIERDRQKALSQLSALKKELEGDRKAIVDLEESARREGVPPGWLR
jgi:hypothetical protein